MHGLEIIILFGVLGLIGIGFIVQLVLSSKVKFSGFLVAASVFLFVLSLNEGEFVEILDFLPAALIAGLVSFGLSSSGAGLAKFLKSMMIGLER